MAKGMRRFALGPIVRRSVDAAEAKDALSQTAWERGVASVANAVDNNRGAYAPLLMVIGGAIAAAIPVGGQFWLRGLAGAGIGLALAWAVPTVWAGLVALRAPYKQRDEARAVVGDVRRLKALVLLERHLVAVRDSNMRTLEEVRREGRTGPLETDGFGEVVTPWFVGQNKQMRLQLEHMGFPELIPELVLDDPSLSTWEEIQRAAWWFARNVNTVLAGPLLDDVRRLDRP